MIVVIKTRAHTRVRMYFMHTYTYGHILRTRMFARRHNVSARIAEIPASHSPAHILALADICSHVHVCALKST